MKNIAKHLLKATIYITLCTMISLSVSCSGEDGQDGMDGAMGPQGPAGLNGQDGQNGNANVIASDWFQVQYDVKDSANPPTWGLMTFQDEDIPELNLDNFVEEGGALLVYAKLYEGPTEDDFIILSTPVSFGSLVFTSGFQYTEAVLSLVIEIRSHDVSSLENIPNLTFRYVLVPSMTMQSFDLNKGNFPETFDEAATLFGLEE
ncbi:MAG: collagen-like protein [Algicola sp.]|nr:collagen-like protein [Algicola sp.]